MNLRYYFISFDLGFGQAVNLAKCLAKFPQASLNYDRDNVYSSIYEKNIQNEREFSLEILNEISTGCGVFKNGMCCLYCV